MAAIKMLLVTLSAGYAMLAGVIILMVCLFVSAMGQPEALLGVNLAGVMVYGGYTLFHKFKGN